VRYYQCRDLLAKIPHAKTCLEVFTLGKFVKAGNFHRFNITLSLLICFEAMLNVAMNQAIKRFDGIIPIKKLIIDSCRSSGPGGQHVNKKNTKVSVSFRVETADWLPSETRSKLAELHRSRINKDGYLTIRSDKTRFQALNIADCMDRLRCYISEAEQPPEPELSIETIELRRQQQERAAAERLRQKRMKSQEKRFRDGNEYGF